jgi:hypothetical protein
VLSAYVRALEQVPRLGDLLEPYPGDSLRSFFKVFVPSTPLALVLYVAAALVTVYIAARIWRSDAPFEIRASGTVVATLLISPHAFPYDLILLAPVYLLLANWLLEHHSRKESWPMSLTLYASFAAPLLSVLPAPLRLQCSVTAMALLLLLLWRVADGADITPAPELGDSARSAAETPAVRVS